MLCIIIFLTFKRNDCLKNMDEKEKIKNIKFDKKLKQKTKKFMFSELPTKDESTV